MARNVKKNPFKLKIVTNAYKMDLKELEFVCSNHCVPFYVDKSGKVVLSTGKTRKITGIISGFLVTLWFAVYALRLVHRRFIQKHDEEVPMSESLLDVAWSTLLLSIFVYKIEYYRKPHETVHLLNETHEWEKEQIEAGLDTVYTHFDEAILWPVAVYLSTLTNVAHPLAAGLLALHSPCLNIFLGSLILPCENTSGTLPLGDTGNSIFSMVQVLVVIFGALEWIVANQNIGPGVLANVPVNYYFTMSLRTFLLAALTGKETKVFETKTLVLYRRFQLHTGMVNICLSPVIFPMMIYTWSVLIIVGAYTAIRLFHSVPLPMYLLFIQLGFDGFMVVNLVFKACGRVNQLSQQLLETWMTGLSKSRAMKLNEKQLKSCPALRVKMGSVNFFEMSTSLVLLDFCANQIVTLLLA